MAALYKNTMEEEQRMINRACAHAADLQRFPSKISGERDASPERDRDAQWSLSSLTGDGVQGNSTLNFGAAVSGLGKTGFRGRDSNSCVGYESQIIPEACYSQVIKC